MRPGNCSICPLRRFPCWFTGKAWSIPSFVPRTTPLYGQFSAPDMKLPIQNALFYPELRPVKAAYTDLCGPPLTFEKPDMDRFPMLRLAYDAAGISKAAPTVYNGSNEIAVAAFLKGRIGFTRIAEVTAEMLSREWSDPCTTLEGIVATDKLVRERAEQFIGEKY